MQYHSIVIQPRQDQPQTQEAGSAMSIQDTVYSVFRKVAKSQDRTLAPLTDDLRLTECGLDSLSFAIVVATLEDELQVDPFTSADGITFPNTLGDFVQLYERAPAPI